MTDPTSPPPPAPDDDVPISVRLGTVVPPEDPEDWTQPLTWVAAIGMLAAPLTALLWFWLARPTTSAPSGMTWILAAVLVSGASLTGSTQIGRARAFAGTLGAALFGALATVIVGLVLAGERQVGSASPTLAQAFVAGMSGLAGAVAASVLALALARQRARLIRFVPPALIGSVVALLIVGLLLE
jgi:MFS family permease